MIPKELVRYAITEKVVPFIGAGFSRSFGYPGWMDLLFQLKQAIGIDDLELDHMKNGDPLQIGQAFLSYYKEVNWDKCQGEVIDALELNDIYDKKTTISESLNKIVREETEKKLELDFTSEILNLIKVNPDNVKHQEKDKLKKLGEINFNYILTTNYDRVLEEEIMVGKNYLVQSLGKGEELDWNEKDKTILKIHGDIESQNGVIFTHSQYYKFMHDFGYFRSKLYTLFSNNVVLMMGYGFNDINIHHTYFQFIRDYGSQINNNKFYMVLTSFDKEKWGSYFSYYKRFLESYKINIIEAQDLPSFVEELSSEIKSELESADLSILFDDLSDEPRFAETLINVVNKESAEYIEKKSLNLDFIRAFNKIFTSPFILSESPFNKDIDSSILESGIGLSIIDYATKMINSNPDLQHETIVMDFINKSLEYVSMTNDFYGIRDRIQRFIDLVCKLNLEGFNLETGEFMYEMFGGSHPTQYLKSNPGGVFLKDNLHRIPSFFIESYLNYLIEENKEEDDEITYFYINKLQKFWLENIKSSAIGKPKVIKLIEEIESLISSSKEESFV
jgi:hypothetical protein